MRQPSGFKMALPSNALSTIESPRLVIQSSAFWLKRLTATLPVVLVFLLPLLSLSAAHPPVAFALSKPPFPVIFVHGLASDSGTWVGLAQFLVEQGWGFGGFPTFNPATLGVTSVFAGDFYTMNFSDYNVGEFHSQYLDFDRQGYELAAIIQAVLNANPGTSKVILVAHSMGGLAAREYLQGLARVNGAAARIAYRGDVHQLITIGTPHLGSALASLCQSNSPACLGLSIDPTSVAVAELAPGSPALVTLNDLAANPLPNPVGYESIAGLGGAGFVSDGDGIVTRVSEEYLSSVPGLTHRLQELFVQDRDDCGTTLIIGNSVVFAERHTCEPGDAGVWSAILDTVLQPRLTLALNKGTVSTGDTLTLTLGVQTGFPGQENVGDLYIGVVLPDGSVYLLTAAGFVLAFNGGSVVPGGLQPFRSNATLSSGTEAIFSAPISTPIPAGQYTFIALLVKSGTGPGDAGNWLSNLATASFTFVGGGSTGGNGAPTIGSLTAVPTQVSNRLKCGHDGYSKDRQHIFVPLFA